MKSETSEGIPPYLSTPFRHIIIKLATATGFLFTMFLLIWASCMLVNAESIQPKLRKNDWSRIYEETSAATFAVIGWLRFAAIFSINGNYPVQIENTPNYQLHQMLNLFIVWIHHMDVHAHWSGRTMERKSKHKSKSHSNNNFIIIFSCVKFTHYLTFSFVVALVGVENKRERESKTKNSVNWHCTC